MTDTKEGNAVILPDFLTVRELADFLEATPIDVIKVLMSNGIMAGINQQIDFETAAIVAAEMGIDAHQESAAEEEEAESTQQVWRAIYEREDPAKLVRRPPVVTVLGHVDHGKTSLLDRIREANVTEGEAGGITQAIGAYQVDHEGQIITFLDTPGHEAFTAMRARGAQGADIAVLVVAADDGIMPQTREAIAHAKAAQVPIIVALNKIDLPGANPDRVKQQLAELDLVPDDWDGTTMVVPVSARSGKGIEDLLQAILLTAEDEKILANPDGTVAGTVLEAELESARGVMTTLLVQNGTLRTGDVVIAGTAYGRIKAMFNELGERTPEAGPSTPVRVMGLNEIPPAGTRFDTVDKEKAARLIVAEREHKGPQTQAGVPVAFTLEELFSRFQEGKAKELNLIVKVDVHGSLEPIVSGLKNIEVIENDEPIKVNILLGDIGHVTESDVQLATASEAIIVGFNVDSDGAARRLAESQGVEIRHYDVIYKLFEDIELALKGLLEPVFEDKVIGTAEVRQLFKIPKIGSIAGSIMRDGEARRDARARVVRNGKIIHEGKVSSLKRFQEDVREVRSGFECGINVDGFEDYREGDLIEFTVRERVR